MHVGLQGLLENAEAVTPAGSVVRILNVTGEVVPEDRNAEAVTPVGRVVRILKVTGDVVADALRVAVAVSTPPATPGVRVRVEGLAARVKSKNPETTRVNVAV